MNDTLKQLDRAINNVLDTHTSQSGMPCYFVMACSYLTTGENSAATQYIIHQPIEDYLDSEKTCLEEISNFLEKSYQVVC